MVAGVWWVIVPSAGMAGMARQCSCPPLQSQENKKGKGCGVGVG